MTSGVSLETSIARWKPGFSRKQPFNTDAISREAPRIMTGLFWDMGEGGPP